MITEEQLRTWTKPGAQNAAQNTYASVKTALERADIPSRFDAEVFLQGSYANHTNTRGDSDVDIVVMMRRSYMPNLSQLSEVEKKRYDENRIPASTNVEDLRVAVELALRSYYGDSRVHPRNKCVKVDKAPNYVDADVVPAQQHRLYSNYSSVLSSSYVEGVSIQPLNGGPRIVNFPKQHLANGKAKNLDCSEHYKPTVRQIKQLRRWAVDNKLVGTKEAPGYLLECMVFNAPTSLFVTGDSRRLREILAWLRQHTPAQLNRSFRSCDEIHMLFQDDPGGHNEYTAERVIETLWNCL